MSDGSGVPPAASSRPLSLRVDTTEIVAAYRKGGLFERTSQNRALKWHRGQAMPVEYLLPRMFRKVEARWPDYMSSSALGNDISRAELDEAIGRLGPWMVPFRMAGEVCTIDPETDAGRQNVANYLYRRSLITETVAEVLGDDLSRSTVLDLGCNSGFFSLDLATRGARHVHGVDPRSDNIARAEFVKQYYRVANVDFAVGDVDTLEHGVQWDVLLNLGVLYHVVDPLQLMRRTFEICGRFAIVDTVVLREPVSAFFLVGDKNTNDPTEGREEWELHPSYRGAIESMFYAGFSEVIEIVGTGDVTHPLYGDGRRRCFLAVK